MFAAGQGAGRVGFVTGGVDPLSALRCGHASQRQSLDGAARRVRQTDGEESTAVIVYLRTERADDTACRASLFQNPNQACHAGAGISPDKVDGSSAIVAGHGHAQGSAAAEQGHFHSAPPGIGFTHLKTARG